MGKRPASKMPISERAKQFAPFDALTGLRRALELKRRELGLIEKYELSEDAVKALDEKLTALRRGDRVSVRYFLEGEYVTVSGAVTKIDKLERFIRLDGEKIYIDDIIDVEAGDGD